MHSTWAHTPYTSHTTCLPGPSINPSTSWLVHNTRNFTFLRTAWVTTIIITSKNFPCISSLLFAAALWRRDYYSKFHMRKWGRSFAQSHGTRRMQSQYSPRQALPGSVPHYHAQQPFISLAWVSPHIQGLPGPPKRVYLWNRIRDTEKRLWLLRESRGGREMDWELGVNTRQNG